LRILYNHTLELDVCLSRALVFSARALELPLCLELSFFMILELSSRTHSLASPENYTRRAKVEGDFVQSHTDFVAKIRKQRATLVRMI
jgi:hypothetical protein